jgi:transposase
MLDILCHSVVKKYLVPHLSIGSSGKFLESNFLTEVTRLIIYRLKTGVQWPLLPVNEFFTERKVSWQGVYYHFREWLKDGSWLKAWRELLSSCRSFLDLSSVQLDGSHTPSKRGGEAVGYQGRKSSKTTNSLYLSDKTGQMLASSMPCAGQHRLRP